MCGSHSSALRAVSADCAASPLAARCPFFGNQMCAGHTGVENRLRSDGSGAPPTEAAGLLGAADAGGGRMQGATSAVTTPAVTTPVMSPLAAVRPAATRPAATTVSAAKIKPTKKKSPNQKPAKKAQSQQRLFLPVG